MEEAIPRKEVNGMTHVKQVSRLLPGKAIKWPADLTYTFIRENLPESVLGIAQFILVQVKNWPS